MEQFSSTHLKTVLDIHGSREETRALLEQGRELVHVRHFVGVLQVVHLQLDGAMVDVVHKQLEDRCADVFQLDVAIVSFTEVRGEHGPKEAALGREDQAMQVELSALHSDGDICKQAVLQTQVHNALDHAAGMGTVCKRVALEIVLLY